MSPVKPLIRTFTGEEKNLILIFLSFQTEWFEKLLTSQKLLHIIFAFIIFFNSVSYFVIFRFKK